MSETAVVTKGSRSPWVKLKEHPLSRVGPGLITGVADDDPGGIATYSQAGAQFGFNMLWTMPLAFPLMAAIQAMCAQIGRVTGKGLAANIKAAFPRAILQGVVLLLLIANTLNIAADVAAMGEVAELVTGFDRHLMTVLFVAITLMLQIFVPYHRYVFFLKWLTLSLLAYAAVLFTVHVPWNEVALRTFLPNFVPNADAATMIVALFGTTISPYLFFWQASEEVEDMQAQSGAKPLTSDAPSASRELCRIQWDTWSGMLYSNLTAYFIILATAVTLNVAGVTAIETAAQAASAFASARRRLRIPAVRLGHSRCGADRSSGPGRLRGLCALRGYGLEMGVGEESDRRPRLLRHYRAEHSCGPDYPVFTDQSDESAILERRGQRYRGGAVDGRYRHPGLEKVGHGRLYGASRARRLGLDRHRYHGGGGRAHVHSGVTGWRCGAWFGVQRSNGSHSSRSARPQSDRFQSASQWLESKQGSRQ